MAKEATEKQEPKEVEIKVKLVMWVQKVPLERVVHTAQKVQMDQLVVKVKKAGPGLGHVIKLSSIY